MGKRTNTAVWLEKYKRWQVNEQRDGIRRTFTCSTPGREGQRKCNAKADAWLDDNLDNSNKRMSVIYSEWMAELKVNTSRGHWSLYEGYWNNWIGPKIGHLRASAVNEQHLQSVITAAHKKGLSKKTLENIRACMANLIKYARKCKATTLLVENLTIPRDAPVGERTILQPNDLVTLFHVDTVTVRGKAVYELFINAYRFEVLTGLRPGEVMGLRWENVSDGGLSMKQSYNKYYEWTKGKNKNAERDFHLTELAQAVLAAQSQKLQELGIESKYVFPDRFGEPIKQCTYYDHWVRYRRQAGLSECTPYELRHTFISIIKPLPVGLVKPVVGHSVAMDTYGTYGHEVDGEKVETANLIQERFKKFLP